MVLNAELVETGLVKNIIHYTNTWAQFQGPGLYQARDMLSYRKKGYTFTQAYRRGHWDGYVRLLTPNGRFAAGLVPWLVEQFEKEGLPVEVKDERPKLHWDAMGEEFGNFSGSVELRSYQEEAIQTAIKEERGGIQHPTGAGKTVVMCELTRRIGYRALILVHRKDLLTQTINSFKEQLKTDKIGIIGDGKWHPEEITVAMFQTLYRRLIDYPNDVVSWLATIGQVHVDEAHHLPAETYGKVMGFLPNALFRFGYSATMFKDEKDKETMFKVMSWTGPIIHSEESADLIKDEKLVPTTIFMINTPDINTSFTSYQEATTIGIVNNDKRNTKIISLAKKLDESNTGPILILTERVLHGRYLSQVLQCPFLEGETPGLKREEVWKGIKTGRINLVVASKIADEGLDIPNMRVLILGGGGKSPHLSIQRIGRGMRISKGKDRLFVIDFLDKGKYVGAHAKQRLKTYKSNPAWEVVEVNFEEIINAL